MYLCIYGDAHRRNIYTSSYDQFSNWSQSPEANNSYACPPALLPAPAACLPICRHHCTPLPSCLYLTN